MKSIAIMQMRKASNFTPVTRTYTTGTLATETVPAGASLCTITVDGAGGAGGRDAIDGWGGGGSGRAVGPLAVAGGNTMTYTIAPAVGGRSTNGTGTNGTASTVTGTVAGGSVNMSAGGGAGVSESNRPRGGYGCLRA